MVNYTTNPQQFRADVGPLIAFPGGRRDRAAQKQQKAMFKRQEKYEDAYVTEGSLYLTKCRHASFMWQWENMEQEAADKLFDKTWDEFPKHLKKKYGKKDRNGKILEPRIPVENNPEEITRKGTLKSDVIEGPHAEELAQVDEASSDGKGDDGDYDSSDEGDGGQGNDLGISDPSTGIDFFGDSRLKA